MDFGRRLQYPYTQKVIEFYDLKPSHFNTTEEIFCDVFDCPTTITTVTEKVTTTPTSTPEPTTTNPTTTITTTQETKTTTIPTTGTTTDGKTRHKRLPFPLTVETKKTLKNEIGTSHFH